jgi:hypothetical protein
MHNGMTVVGAAVTIRVRACSTLANGKRLRRGAASSDQWLRRAECDGVRCAIEMQCCLGGPLLSGVSELLVDEFPIHQVPEGLEVIRARVAIVDVVGMFPHVAAE